MTAPPVSVFIVDDSPQVIEMLSELLALPGRGVLLGTSDSASEAVAQIRSLRPNVVVVDIQLRDGTGFEVVNAIRGDPHAGGVVIIFFTNYLSAELKKRAIDAGADHFLDKSRDHEVLLEILDRLRSHPASGD